MAGQSDDNYQLEEGTLEAILAQEISAAQTYDSSELADRRKKAVEYVNGTMTDWPAESGRSSINDFTVGETLSWMLPQIIRIFSASDQFAIAEPVEESDEGMADQATVGINYTFAKANKGYAILHDATYNALLHGNGIVKHWWNKTPQERVSFHTGLGDLELMQLLEPEDNAVDERGQPCETIELISHKQQLYELEPGDEGYGGYGTPDAGLDNPMAGGQGAQLQISGPPAGPGSPGDADAALDGGAATPGGENAPAGLPGPPNGMQAGPQMPPSQPMQQQMAVPMPPQPQYGRLHDVKIRRRSTYGKLDMMAVAPEDFIISSEAICIADARLHGHKIAKTRSDLIKEGFDRDKVMGLSEMSVEDSTQLSRNDGATNHLDAQPIDNRAMEQVIHYELYYRIDVDGDDIAELIQCHFMGAPDGTGTLLEWSIWEDEPVFTDIPTYRIPHRWNADGVYWRMKDIQEVNTVLERAALDNMYGTIDPQAVISGRVLNPEVLNSPGFGTKILLDEGGSVSWSSMPFFADKAFEGIQFMREMGERRTGVSRQTMALDPEALQNTTATAAQLGHDANYVMVEYVARNHSELGWKEVFKTILKLMVRHQRKSQTIRLTNKKWVSFDPKDWNADMDITINTGLGTGSRDRDAQMLTSVQADQVALAQIFREAQMPHLALQMVPKIVDGLKKKAEAVGIRAPDQFYPEVGPQDLQIAWQGIQQANSQPPLELQLADKQAQLALALEDKRVQTTQAVEAAKAQALVAKNQAEMDADLQVKLAEQQKAIAIEREQQQAEGVKLWHESQEKEKDRALEIMLKRMDLAGREEIAGMQAENNSANKAADRSFKASESFKNRRAKGAMRQFEGSGQ
jgi:hypothetical protein